MQKSKHIIYLTKDQLNKFVDILYKKLNNKSKNDIKRLLNDGAIKWMGEKEDWIIKENIDNVVNTFSPIDSFDFNSFINFLEHGNIKLYGCFKIGKKEFIWL